MAAEVLPTSGMLATAARDLTLALLVILLLNGIRVHLRTPVTPRRIWDKPEGQSGAEHTGFREGESVYVAPFSGGPYAQVLAKRIQRHTSLQEQLVAGNVPLTRAVIARCIPGQVCGGLGDRIFGILTLYLGAILTDRAFFIEHSKPQPLSSYLEPNGLEWRIEKIQDDQMRGGLENCTAGIPQYQDCTFLKMLLPKNTCSRVLTALFSSQPVLVLHSNHRTECIQKLLVRHDVLPETEGLKFGNDPEELRMWAANVSHMLFHHLFKFSPDVIKTAGKGFNLLQKETTAPFDCTMCLHIRSGVGLRERARYTNYRDFSRCGLKAEWLAVKNQVCPKSKSVAWLVVSDDEDAAKRVAKLATNLTVYGTSALGAPAHLDKMGANPAGLRHIYADWYLLTRCRHLVASLSTFSATAAIVHGRGMKRYDVEVRDKGGFCEERRFSDFQRDANMKVKAHH